MSIKTPPPLSLIAHIDESLTISPNNSEMLSNNFPHWPIYNAQITKGFNQYPNTSVPILFLQGELDPNTNHGWGVHGMGHYTKPRQHFESIPYAAHGTLSSSPIQGSTDTCGMLMMTSFIMTGEADRSCIENLVPPDFDGVMENTRALSTQLFGTPDMWGL